MTEAKWLASDDPGEMLRYLLEVARPRTEEGGGGVPGTSDRKLRLWVEACRLASEPGRTSWSYDLDKPKHLCRAVAEWSRLDNEDDHGTAASRAALLREVVGNPFRPVKLSASWLTPDVLAIAQAAYDDRDEVSGHLDPVRLAILADALEETGYDSEELRRHLRGWERCTRCGSAGKNEAGWRWTGIMPALHERCGCDAGWRPLSGPHVRGCWAVDLILGKE